MNSDIICPHCGERMELFNMYSDHYICEICKYEINLDGVINSCSMWLFVL